MWGLKVRLGRTQRDNYFFSMSHLPFPRAEPPTDESEDTVLYVLHSSAVTCEGENTLLEHDRWVRREEKG